MKVLTFLRKKSTIVLYGVTHPNMAEMHYSDRGHVIVFDEDEALADTIIHEWFHTQAKFRNELREEAWVQKQTARMRRNLTREEIHLLAETARRKLGEK